MLSCSHATRRRVIAICREGYKWIATEIVAALGQLPDRLGVFAGKLISEGPL
jgi:hypothetical protein